MDIRVSRDFERSGEFRLLSGHYGAAGAAFIWMRLYVDLAYAVQTTGRLGWMSEGLVQPFLDSLAEIKEEAMARLVEVDLLEVSPDGGWYCRKFAEDNPHLAPGHKSIQSRGGDVRSFNLAQKRLEGEVPRQTLLLPDELFKRPDGQEMTPEDVRRVTMIIRSVDNALKLPMRATATYTKALIHDAWSVHVNFTDAEINEACLVLVHHRRHPSLPKQTEQILPRLKELVGKLASGK